MNRTNVSITVPPQEAAAGTITGETVDLADTEKHFLAIKVGNYAGGTIQVKIQESVDAAFTTPVDVDEETQIRGNLYDTAITPTGSNQVYYFELLSKFKRYARAQIVVAGGTIPLSADFIESRLEVSYPSDRNVSA